MSRIGNEIRRALIELEGDLGDDSRAPQTLTWKGTPYPIVPKKSVEGLDLSIGGLSPNATVTFIIRREFFTTDVPAAKQYVSAPGGRFIILKVNESADHSFIRLDCNIAGEGV